jgi:hypothetical protein
MIVKVVIIASLHGALIHRSQGGLSDRWASLADWQNRRLCPINGIGFCTGADRPPRHLEAVK